MHEHKKGYFHVLGDLHERVQERVDLLLELEPPRSGPPERVSGYQGRPLDLDDPAHCVERFRPVEVAAVVRGITPGVEQNGRSREAELARTVVELVLVAVTADPEDRGFLRERRRCAVGPSLPEPDPPGK